MTIHRSDYTRPNFLVEHVSLTFHLHPTATRVIARTRYTRQDPGDLFLNGEALRLDRLLLDDRPFAPETVEGGLWLRDLPDQFTLLIETAINPEANSELSGLYLSGGNFFTHCEAEGFRRTTVCPALSPGPRARGGTRHLGARGRSGSLRPCDGIAQGSDALGRGKIRPRI